MENNIKRIVSKDKKIDVVILNKDEIVTKIDRVNNFTSVFNRQTGAYIRTGIIENNKDTGIDPFMSALPELIDIGVMG